MRNRSIFAGRTLLVEKSGVEITIEDWAENVLSAGWIERLSEPAPLFYAARVLTNKLPIDNAVLYGKINNLGTLVHVSELAFPAWDGSQGLQQEQATLKRDCKASNNLTPPAKQVS